MTMNELNDMYTKISTPSFFDFLKSLKIDGALDARDEAPFDDQWIENFNRLEKESFDKKYLEMIDRIREYLFKESFKTIGSDEISAKISDDLELIAKDLALNNKDNWPINYLWKSYQNGVFPV